MESQDGMCATYEAGGGLVGVCEDLAGPVTTFLPRQEVRKVKKKSISIEQADELLKSLEFVTFPELEEDSEHDLAVKKYRKTVRKERMEKELCPVEKAAKEVNFAEVGDEGVRMSLRFQVADVKKPLISVKRIVEQGSKVGFGPKDGDNFILNEASGGKILKSNGKGSYLMAVKFAAGETTKTTDRT